MQLKFWGVRGSLPVPSSQTLRVGGNTTCVSIEHGECIAIFDAGTGIYPLGKYLVEAERDHLTGSIFLSHYHWDHIQGLPFFAPAFRSDNRFHLYGEEKTGSSLFELLEEQMQVPFFPVDIEQQKGLVAFNAVSPDQRIEIAGGMIVTTVRLSHPSKAVGYRLDCQGKSVCIITDHEHPDDGVDPAIVEFARGATVLIHEAPYSAEQKQGPRKGWGHSSWEEAATVAREAEVGRLYISHHDPATEDDDVAAIEAIAREIFENSHIATESTLVSDEDFASLGG